MVISNPWGMTCREQILYWIEEEDDARKAGDEESLRNARENQANWILLENHFGPDSVVPDLSEVSDDEMEDA